MSKLNIGEIMLNFERLKAIREDKDIKQEQMASILGVKRSTYSLWELSINIIPLKHLSKFSDYFNYSIDYIAGLEKERKHKNQIKGLNLKTLGKNMKDIRTKKGLSQENIAEILGVSQACIAKYEKGIISISTNNLYKFCKEFKISLNKICGKE